MNKKRYESHFRQLSVNPPWHPSNSPAAPSMPASPLSSFWDLTIIHPTPEAEEDMRAAAQVVLSVCGPFGTGKVPDWKS